MRQATIPSAWSRARVVLALALCSLGALSHSSRVHAEPSAAAPARVERVVPEVHVAHAVPVEGARQPSCPPLADNPFDEAPPAKVIDLNRADERALLDLPGIGPARARAILDYRAAHGSFRSISQLLNIKGIGRSLLKQLRPLLTLTAPSGSVASASQ